MLGRYNKIRIINNKPLATDADATGVSTPLDIVTVPIAHNLADVR
jgi:hypothetical protein